VPHTYVAGETLTAVNMELLPKGSVGYVEATGAQTGIGAAATDITSLTLTFTAVASHRYLILWKVIVAQQTSTGVVQVILTDGSNVQKAGCAATFTAGVFGNMSGMWSIVPGAGSTTYKLRAFTSAGTVDLSQSASAPSSLQIVDIGA
jgi:hypothetical protein